MVLSDSQPLDRSTRIIPMDASLRRQDAWAVDTRSTYKSLTANPDSDISQLSVNFDDKTEVPSDCIVPQHKNVGISTRTRCPWKIPWIAITNCCVQITVFALRNKKLFKLLIYSPYKKNEIWRFLTYSLLHSDVIHLIVNVVLQIITAFALETEQGHINVLIVYVCGVLAGSLGTSIFQKELWILGSSAGVCCLLLSHVPHLVLNFSTLPYRYYRVVSVIVICLNDILLTTLDCLRESTVQPKIGLAVAAHITGGWSGLVLGFALYSGERTSTLQIVRLISVISYCVFVLFAIMMNLK